MALSNECNLLIDWDNESFELTEDNVDVQTDERKESLPDKDLIYINGEQQRDQLFIHSIPMSLCR